jgi:membrane fusion protein (multidrug efflux system)
VGEKIGLSKSMVPLIFVSILLLFYILGCNSAQSQAEKDQRKEQRSNETKIAGEVTEKTEKQKTVRIKKPRIRKISHSIETVGTFLPFEEVSIKSEAEGKVKTIFFDEGDQVKKEDILLKLDDEEYILKAKRAEARLYKTQKEWEHAHATYLRYQDLYEQGIIGKQQFDDMATKASLAEAETKNAQVELELERKHLRDTNITAPIDGIISERLISPGEFVQLRGDGQRGGNKLFTLVQISPIRLDTAVTDKSAPKIFIGQKIRIKVRPFPNEEFVGKVYFINPQMDPTTKALRFKADFDNADGRLKPGMFADVFIIIDEDVPSLFVPEESVLSKQGKHVLYVLESGRARRQEVQSGVLLDGEVEILAGIKKDDLVIVEGNYELSPGAKVKALMEGR